MVGDLFVKCVCYTMAMSGLPVIHKWSVFIGHDGIA